VPKSVFLRKEQRGVPHNFSLRKGHGQESIFKTGGSAWELGKGSPSVRKDILRRKGTKGGT